MCYIFRTGRPTNFNLGNQTEHKDPPIPATSVVILAVVGIYVESRKKSPRNTKIGRKIVHPAGYNAHQFSGQKSRSQVD